MIQFEGMERRTAGINACLEKNGLGSLESCDALCKSRGIDVGSIVKGVQPIAFDNAVWAYTLGTAIALNRGVGTAAEAAECIGEGLQAFCVPGSVADQRKGWPGPWQSRRHAAPGGDPVLLLPGRA